MAVSSLTMFVDMHFRLPALVRFDDDAQLYVAWCPPVDIRSQGETMEEAKAAVLSAVTLYLRTCFQRKILDDVLVRKGFTPVTTVEYDQSCRPDVSQDSGPYSDLFDLEIPMNLASPKSRADGVRACLS
jgi:predicted RNase H-like HicB family nuclease